MKEVRKRDSFPTIFVLLLLMFMTICIMVCKYKTDAYTVELESTKISEVNLNDDRNIIGYADTAHGTAKVYDKSYSVAPYVCTYQYTYNGEQYEYIYKSSMKMPDTIRIYLNPDEPSDFCFAFDKVSWKEFMTNYN